MKRIFSRFCLLLVLFALCASPLLISCGAKPPKDLVYTRVLLNIGAQVELFIDPDETVKSATPLNDDGCIILDRDPVGEHVVLTVRRLITEAIEYGLMPRGANFASDNLIAITVSGESRYAKKLWETLLAEAGDALRVEQTSGSVVPGENPTVEELKLLVTSASYYTADDLTGMDEAALLSLLADIRIETAELFFADTSRIYLHNLADMTALARYRRVAEILAQNGTAEEKSAFENALTAYESAVYKLCEVRYTAFAAADGDYAKAVRGMREITVKMVELCREMTDLSLTTEEYGKASEALDALGEELDVATDARDALWQSGHMGISMVKKQATKAADTLNALMEKHSEQIKSLTAAALTDALTETARTAYRAEFFAEHGADLAQARAYLEEYRAALSE